MPTKRRLGVNIDHIATLRQARRVSYPEPVAALDILKACHVDQVTIHLREDRRHIQDADLYKILDAQILPVNLEMAVTDEMVAIARKSKPATVTFVPERREEITTEGGLDCIAISKRLVSAINRLQDDGIRVSLFIDHDAKQVEMAKSLNADGVEFHTGAFCHTIEHYFEATGSYDYSHDRTVQTRVDELFESLKFNSQLAAQSGLKVFAGHGLHCHNLKRVATIQEIEEYNIGHAIIARSIFVGLKQAIQEIHALLAD